MMHTRILVAYATTFGSTAEIAEAIGAALRHDHTEVDVREVLDVDDLRPYDAVVVGSAIYNGEWLPEAVQFVRLHEATLCRMPVAYFAACMIVQRPTPQHQRTARLYVDAVQQTAPSIQPVDVGVFTGNLRYRNLPLLERIEFFFLSRLPSGDFRDWNAIWAWAAAVRPALLGSGAR
jgi:menaquinone-dependent protoporphyrinogen oxidase